MSKARELSELGDKITVDGSGNSTFDGDVSAANLSTTGNVTVSGTVDGRDVAADGTKLDGIEAGADVTDTANVTAAGALMDSEVTNLAAVKAFDPTDYATAAQGTLADSAVQPNDSPSFAGLTVDTNTLYVDSTNNRVGINTSSPAGGLHVEYGEVFFKSTGNSKLQINAGNTSSAFIEFGDPDDGNVGRLLYAHSDNSMQFTVNAAERMRIDSAGQLMVGTTAGNSTAGGGHFTGPLLQGASGLYQQQISINSGQNIQSVVLGVGYSNLLLNALGGNVGIGTSSPTALFGSGTTVEINGTGGAGLRLARPSYATADLYADETGLTIRTANSYPLVFRTNNTERARIDASGNLLVGRTNTINGNTNTTGGAQIGSNGLIQAAVSGDTAIALQRLNTDGDIIQFRKDNTKVGSIRSRAGAVSTIILDPSATGGGLSGGGAALYPTDHAGTLSNGALSLGDASYRFNNLYLSGSISDGTNSKTVAQLAASAAYDADTSSTGYLDLPSGTTAQRPASPDVGNIRYNTTDSVYEAYFSGGWRPLATAPITADILVVAGGGGGGGRYGGGGGAGGYLYQTAVSLSYGATYTVTVGSGGSGGPDSGSLPTAGGNSVVSGSGLSTITAIGGGRGSHRDPFSEATNGGSGGGAGSTVQSGTSGQGNAGGVGMAFYGGSSFYGSGGGGAGAAGVNANTNGRAGDGGAGSSNSITGSSVTYAGGGGGGAGLSGTTAGFGGAGGGGAGGVQANGTSGTANTGGGGGGSGETGTGGNGGSGVVIFRSLTAASSTTGSPTVTTSGGYNIYKFTGSGSITF